MLELIFLGLFVGSLSGFFGVGGGTVLIPILLFLGYETKIAIGISVVQMVFSSIYGSYLNHKKGTLDIAMVTSIGIGGFIGAQTSGFITAFMSDFVLELVFLFFAIFALGRLFFSIKEQETKREVSRITLVLIGFFIGAMSMSIGVGGSLLLVPILVGFLHISLKNATSAGLFFVVFSSVSGFISHSIYGEIDIYSGVIIGLASLFGVYIGVHLKEKVNAHNHKRLLMFFYLLIVGYLTQRIFL